MSKKPTTKENLDNKEIVQEIIITEEQMQINHQTILTKDNMTIEENHMIGQQIREKAHTKASLIKAKVSTIDTTSNTRISLIKTRMSYTKGKTIYSTIRDKTIKCNPLTTSTVAAKDKTMSNNHKISKIKETTTKMDLVTATTTKVVIITVVEAIITTIETFIIQKL